MPLFSDSRSVIAAIQKAVDAAHERGVTVRVKFKETGFFSGEGVDVDITAEPRRNLGTMASPSRYDCLRSLKRDEPYFVVRSRDRYGPKIVRHWAAVVMNDPAASAQSREKAAEAYELAGRMEAWQTKNGCKVPD